MNPSKEVTIVLPSHHYSWLPVVIIRNIYCSKSLRVKIFEESYLLVLLVRRWMNSLLFCNNCILRPTPITYDLWDVWLLHIRRRSRRSSSSPRRLRSQQARDSIWNETGDVLHQGLGPRPNANCPDLLGTFSQTVRLVQMSTRPTKNLACQINLQCG